MQAGQCGNQMGIKIFEMVRDENGIGGNGECCGDNDAQLGRFNVFHYEASSGKNVPRAVLFDLKPGVIVAVTLSCRSASSSARETSQTKTRTREATGPRASH
jgi:tubulin beta